MAKRKQTNRYTFVVVLLAAFIAYLVPRCQEQSSRSGSDYELSDSVLACRLELPAPISHLPECILQHKGYPGSYNSATMIPTGVAWELPPDRLTEAVSRTNKYLPDPLLPAFEAVTTADYVGATDASGAKLDRGHLCPAGDNKWDEEAMMESFYLTNICPQNHNLNRGDWKELEEACRHWAQKYGKIYIVCGPVLYNQPHHTLSCGKAVTVPEAFFKCVLVMGDDPQAIGFLFKNTACNHKLAFSVNSIDQVERITGFDLFASLPDYLEARIEADYNLNYFLY